MISRWKAMAREEIDVQQEPGKVINVDLMALSLRDVPMIQDETATAILSPENTKLSLYQLKKHASVLEISFSTPHGTLSRKGGS